MRQVCRGVPGLTAAAMQFRHQSHTGATATDAKMQPVNVLDSLLLAYSPGLDYLAVGTRDGRVKAFDTATGGLIFHSSSQASLEPSEELAGLAPRAPVEQATCLTWVKSPDKGTQNGAVSKLSAAGLLVAVGFASGTVRAISAAAARHAWAAQNCNEGGVASLAYAAGAGSSGLLYSVGADCMVCALDAATGAEVMRFKAGSHALSCVGAAPDCQSVLVASSSLALWSVVRQKRQAKFMGHTLPVRAVAFSPDGRHALSASGGEPQIAVWRLEAPSSKKSQPSCGLLLLEDPAVQIASSPAPSSAPADTFQVAAVSSAGKAYVWRCGLKDDGRVESSLSACISTEASAAETSGNQGEGGVLAVAFESPDSILLARGSAVKPTFERMKIPKGSSSKAAHIQLPRVTEGTLIETSGRGGPTSTSTQKAGRKQAAYVGAEPVSTEHLKPSIVDSDAARPNRKRRAEDAETAIAITAAEEPMPTEGLTLGQRLEALQLRQQGAEMEVDEEEQGALMKDALRADSVAVLLGQALQAQDRALLERCLAVKSERIINNSVARLRPHHAAALLEGAVERLRTRARRGTELTVWIRAVLTHHTAYLMAAPGVLPILAMLSQTIEARTAYLKPLAALAGRLDLLTAHLPKQHESSAAPDPLALPEPQVVYVEEDEVETEDPFAAEQEDGRSQETGEDSDEGDEDLQDANHDDALDDDSEDE